MLDPILVAETDVIPEPYLKFLDELSTDDKPHSGRTLRDHLVGTYEMLADWGCPEHVCTAGLFHSIYGTASYRNASTTFAKRDAVRAVIGADAEELAYLFCIADRRGFFYETNSAQPRVWDRLAEALIETTPQRIDELLDVEAANLIEQIDIEKVPPQAVGNFKQMLARAEGHMAAPAFAAFADFVASMQAARG